MYTTVFFARHAALLRWPMYSLARAFSCRAPRASSFFSDSGAPDFLGSNSGLAARVHIGDWATCPQTCPHATSIPPTARHAGRDADERGNAVVSHTVPYKLRYQPSHFPKTFSTVFLSHTDPWFCLLCFSFVFFQLCLIDSRKWSSLRSAKQYKNLGSSRGKRRVAEGYEEAIDLHC